MGGARYRPPWARATSRSPRAWPRRAWGVRGAGAGWAGARGSRLVVGEALCGGLCRHLPGGRNHLAGGSRVGRRWWGGGQGEGCSREREARTRRLIAYAGLVAIAGLDEEDKGTVLGVLLEGARRLPVEWM